MTSRNSTDTQDGTVRHKAHWTIFLPAIFIALLYGGSWLSLLAAGKGDTALARIVLLVILMVVPVLFVRASLRYQSFGLLIGRQALTYRRGWIRPRWHRIQMDALVNVRAVQTPFSRFFGGGALEFTETDGRKFRFYDLKDPDQVARQISRRVRVMKSRLKPI
ncbi:MAG: PH domain-containing protein [Alphaproteobacteria bacterium]